MRSKYRSVGGFRPTFDWESESKEEVRMGATIKNVSATLRRQSQEVEAFATSKTKASEDRVTEALKSRMSKLGKVKDLLQGEVTRTDIAVTKMALNNEKTIRQLAKQKLALDLNQRRLLVRETRPERETTHDEVQSRLVSQQRALQANIDKLERCAATNAKDRYKLMQDRASLAADLQDKTKALSIDNELYTTTASGDVKVDGPLQKATTTYPHKWLGSSEDEMRRVRGRQADAGRLRGAIGNAINETKATSRAMDSALRSALRSKIRSTEKLATELDAQLAGVRGEMAQADQRRDELEAALAAKMEPLALGKQRYHMRHARPAREKVHDEVEDALSSEFNDLNYICSQLEKKIAAVNGERARLAAHAAVLEANVADKTNALAADRAVLYLDDAAETASNAASSVYAHSSASGSSVGSRAMAADRIAKLEGELDAARAARMRMEAEFEAAVGRR